MFDRKRLFKNIEKNYDNILESDFLNFIKADMADRLEPLQKECSKLIAIRDHENFITDNLKEKLNIKEVFNLNDEEQISTVPGKVDIIIFPLGLHWTNNVQEFLANCANLLNDDGLFICNFFGAGSLKNLRSLFYEVEQSLSRPHSPHIIPLIQFDHVTPLLQQAGFIENIIDMEKFDLEFESPLKLMKALKTSASSNILSKGVGYSINKKMYEHFSSKQEKFIDNVNVITFIASKSKNSIKLKTEYFNPG